MSSSKCTPFQDITNRQNLGDNNIRCFELAANCAIYAYPKEVKRQMNREYYAKNKDDISRRQRQAQELKKQAALRDAPNVDNMSNASSWTIRSHPTEIQNTRSCVLYLHI
jgi:glycerol-3-phosphate dehydrogenase